MEREAGFAKREVHHFKKPVEKPFTKDQRGKTTLLFGGLTWKHEKLVHGALEGLGYRAEAVPTPNVKAFQTGKEYGNNGQCNPTYFTVGNLVQYLQSLEEQGLTKQEIIDRYVFFTAGACGPCRFGMYEAEYRLALRNSRVRRFPRAAVPAVRRAQPVRRRSRPGNEPRLLPGHPERAELRRRDE